MTPETGQYFIDGLGMLSVMHDSDYYQHVGHQGKLIYLDGHPDWGCKEIVEKDYKFKEDEEMKTEFVSVLHEGHDTTKGLQKLEAQYIEHVYKLSKYNQVKAANMLGLSRGCLRMKLKQYFDDKYI